MVQRPGTSIVEFFERFPDEDACLHHIFQTRWGDHTPCPKCNMFGRWFHIRGTKKYQHSCRRHVSVLADTVLYRSNLSLMAWFYAMLLLCNASVGMRGMFLRRQLGLGTRSAVRLGNAIRMQMAAYHRPAQLGGPGKSVYVDEAIIRQGLSGAGDGPGSNPIVMGFACDGRILTGIIPSRSGAAMRAGIEQHVAPGSRIVSDNHASYKRLRSLGWDHVIVNHSVAFHDFAGNHMNDIETFWRVLKRTLAGYRMINPENLWLYLAEVEFRYTHRRSSRSNFEILIDSFPDVSGPVARQLERRFDWR